MENRNKPITKSISRSIKTGKIKVGRINKKYFTRAHGGNLPNR